MTRCDLSSTSGESVFERGSRRGTSSHFPDQARETRSATSGGRFPLIIVAAKRWDSASLSGMGGDCPGKPAATIVAAICRSLAVFFSSLDGGAGSSCGLGDSGSGKPPPHRGRNLPLAGRFFFTLRRRRGFAWRTAGLGLGKAASNHRGRNLPFAGRFLFLFGRGSRLTGWTGRLGFGKTGARRGGSYLPLAGRFLFALRRRRPARSGGPGGSGTGKPAPPSWPLSAARWPFSFHLVAPLRARSADWAAPRIEADAGTTRNDRDSLRPGSRLPCMRDRCS